MVRRGCTVLSPLTWPSAKKSDDTKKFATTGSVDGFSVLLGTQFVLTRLREETSRISPVRSSLPLMETARERPEFAFKSSFGAPHLILPQGYLLKSFQQVNA